jgi:hypothetical protein
MKTSIVKTYKWSAKNATKLFQEDLIKMEKKGYYPVSQNWAPWAYWCQDFFVAILLCIILIWIIIFLYMLFVKPNWTLTVTYKLDKNILSNNTKNKDEDKYENEKICPMCAEYVKSKAKICRFCKYEF